MIKGHEHNAKFKLCLEGIKNDSIHFCVSLTALLKEFNGFSGLYESRFVTYMILTHSIKRFLVTMKNLMALP